MGPLALFICYNLWTKINNQTFNASFFGEKKTISKVILEAKDDRQFNQYKLQNSD